MNFYDIGSVTGDILQKNERNPGTDKIVIEAYERSIKELGLIPDTEEILRETKHDNYAMQLRIKGVKTLESLSYKHYKAVNHVIENKYNYIGKEIKDGIITGIGKNSICLEKEEKTTYFWYLTHPSRYNNCNNKGIDLAKELIEKYGE